jgi:flagellar basal-body rod modification protein FlgD
MSEWIDIVNVPKNNSIYKNIKPFEEKSQLGKDEFLRILTTQLSHQDPSSPLQDKDFIAQMATFSSLEQMTNLNKSFESFASSQMNQYATSIGKEISWTPTGSTSASTGVVNGISKQDGNYFYLVGNEKVPMNQVTEIKQITSEPASSDK